MKFFYKYFIMGIIFSLVFVNNAFTQNVDTGYIKTYEKQNSLEVFPGFYTSKFNFASKDIFRPNYRLQANTSAYYGIYVTYKWLAVTYGWAIPSTYLDKNVRFKYTRFEYLVNKDNFSIHPYFNAYNGLLEKTGGLKKESRFVPENDVKFRNAGIDFRFYDNSKTFSSRAANSFSEKQMKSAGSYYWLVKPMWQSIKWKEKEGGRIKDSLTYKLISFNPQWISITGGLGYNYSFSIRHGNWLISPAGELAVGGLKMINNPEFKIQPVFSTEARMNVGYNGSNIYCYLYSIVKLMHSKLGYRNLNNLDSDFSLVVGYRFRDYKKRILKVL